MIRECECERECIGVACDITKLLFLGIHETGAKKERQKGKHRKSDRREKQGAREKTVGRANELRPRIVKYLSKVFNRSWSIVNWVLGVGSGGALFIIENLTPSPTVLLTILC